MSRLDHEKRNRQDRLEPKLPRRSYSAGRWQPRSSNARTDALHRDLQALLPRIHEHFEDQPRKAAGSLVDAYILMNGWTAKQIEFASSLVRQARRLRIQPVIHRLESPAARRKLHYREIARRASRPSSDPEAQGAPAPNDGQAST